MPADIADSMRKLFDSAKLTSTNIGHLMEMPSFCQGMYPTSDRTDITKYLNDIEFDVNFYTEFTENYIEVDTEGETGIEK